MKLNTYQTTHIGKRDVNQDSYGSARNGDWSCFFVADGLGGHYKGELAANAVCAALKQLAKQFSNEIFEDPIQGMTAYLTAAVEDAKTNIIQEFKLVDTQTTLAMIWLNEKHLITTHIGDSRVYLLNEERVMWRTPDHTEVQELFERGEITERQMQHHPLQNQLLNAINLFEPPDPDIFVHPPLALGETIVLCTDGFWGLCSPHDLMDIAQNRNGLSKRIDAMINEFVEHSGDECDNITVQIIKPIST